MDTINCIYCCDPIDDSHPGVQVPGMRVHTACHDAMLLVERCVARSGAARNRVGWIVDRPSHNRISMLDCYHNNCLPGIADEVETLRREVTA